MTTTASEAPTSEAPAALAVGAASLAPVAHGRIKVDKIDNVMGSQAGAGSGDFHMYRGHRRTEMLRVERMDRAAAVDDLEEAHEARVAAKRKECEDRTARNAEKRRKKKATKAKRDAVHAGTGGSAAFQDDGSFMEKARAQLAAAAAKKKKEGGNDAA